MMRIHKLLQTVKLEDVQIRKVEKLIGTRLPSVTDSDFEDRARIVGEHVEKFKAWFDARKSDSEFVKVFKSYAHPRLDPEEEDDEDDDKEARMALRDEELFKRLKEWPAKMVAVAVALSR